MGPYVTMVVAIFIFVFAAVSIQSQSATCTGPLSDPFYCNGVAEATPQATSSATISGICRAPTADEMITFQGPQDEATKCPNGPSGSYKSGGDFRNNFKRTTTYKLVRKNVPLNKEFFTKSDGSEHSTKAVDENIQTSLDATKYELYFPQISGEIKVPGNSPYSRTRDCGDRSYESQGLVYFIDYGMAFGLILQNGKPVESGNFYMTDVFKDIDREEVPQVAFDQCSGLASTAPLPSVAPTVPNSQVFIPEQKESQNNSQLQLSYFLFSNGTTPGASSSPVGGITAGWVDTCKPAIYLYPPKEQLVNVKVYPQGFLTYTDPIYNLKTGWIVNAFPNGNLTTTFNQIPTNYSYLYYESKIRDEAIIKPTKGWVVKYNELEALYQNILPKLGLNSQQMTDFIDYWNKALKPAPYYFVGVVDQSNVDQIEQLEITPRPDFINRVRIYFERLDGPKVVEAPVLTSPSTLNASRFNVVEWGGMVKNDPNHPFTCSQ
jgi:hypothetical protein